jgi:hypothetical protein
MTEPKPIKLELTLEELKLIDKYVEANDDTYSVLMKIINAYPSRKSPVEEAYKDAYGYYPDIEYNMNSFSIFQKGYEASKNNSEDISRVLIEGDDAYIMGVKYQRVPYCPDEPEYYDEVESDIDENKKKPNTLYDLINRWWMDVFCGINKDWDMETSIEDLVDRVELWILRNKK